MHFSLKLLPFFLTLSILPFAAADKIEVVSDLTDHHFFTALLRENNLNHEVVSCDFSTYPGVIKENGLWGKILKKLPDSVFSLFDKDNVEKIVFMNIPIHASRDLILSRMPKNKMILFMWEPPLRLRSMYSKKTTDCFHRIYTWDDDLVDNKTYFKFYYPVLRPMIEDIPSFEQKQLCTMVIGHTSDKSKHPEELYTERKKAIEFFEKVNESGWAFYGKNWDPSRYKSYKGPVDDKIGTIKNYRFVICYENSKDIKGYITEKIFDGFTAGTVPIYWGASNVEDYIPKDCFIDRRDFKDLEQLYAFLKAMKEEEYNAYLQRIRDFLKSEKAQVFSQENFNKILCQAISQ